MDSGRASFEVPQKASMAEVPMMSAISARSSLAVDPANKFGVTIVGFLCRASMVVYSRPHRFGEPDPIFERSSSELSSSLPLTIGTRHD